MFRLHQLQHEILQLFSSFLLQFCATSAWGGDGGTEGRISSVAITWLNHVKRHLPPFRALKQFPFHLVSSLFPQVPDCFVSIVVDENRCANKTSVVPADK